jgi:hypothetical protein
MAKEFMRMDTDDKEKDVVKETTDVKGIDETLKTKLIGLGLKEEQVKKLEDEGVANEADVLMLTADQIKEFTGCGLITAKKVLVALVPVVEKPVVSTSVEAPISYDALPQVPDDSSFLEMLRSGGILKPGPTEVISAIRSALADRSNLYELPNIIIKSMESFAEKQDEPVSAEYYTIQKLVTRRNYSEIFAALDLDSASVTKEKKRKLLDKLETFLWPAVSGYHKQVVSWVQAWQQGAANPAIMMAAITSLASGGTSGLPAGIMQPPDSSGLRDAAEGVIDQINKVFSGTGIVIARALALDANRIKEVLDNSNLPVQVGATNREQMLKMFGVNVSADYVRLERNITRYALAIMEFPKVTAGQSELVYLNALYQLGTAIPWDKLEEGLPKKGSSFHGTEYDESR